MNELIQEFLKILPRKQMSFAELSFGASKSARLCRQKCAAYGDIGYKAMIEAAKIKYPDTP